MSAKHGEFMRGHQSYQDRDIQLGAPTRDKLDNYISSYKRPIDTVTGKVLTYCERLSPLKLHDPLIT